MPRVFIDYNRWYVIQIQPSLLQTAKAHLSRQNFSSFFPMKETRRTKLDITTEPLFAGYGFVRFDIDKDRWLSVNGTRGVIQILPKHSEIPTPMPVGIVEKFIENDPIRDDKLLEVFEEFYPGITEIEVNKNHYWLAGKRGLVVGVRLHLLQVSLEWERGKNYNPVWLDKQSVSIVKPEEV